jgi:Domain of unknown function (DUF4386)
VSRSLKSNSMKIIKRIQKKGKEMITAHKTSRVLGVAFLLQFVTSFGSGVFLKNALIVPGNISESMVKIANNPALMRAYILVDMLTALGIIFLGTMLFLTLRKQNETMALVALGFYILEAALLAVSRLEAFSLLGMSQAYAAAGQPASLQTMASVALESMNFVGVSLHMLAFCPGGILFYYLLYKSRVVPHALSLWGLITVLPCLIGTLLVVFGYEAPPILYVLYMPFELIIGLWILVKGIDEASETRQRSAFASASA